ncbi:synaptonemal complex protein 2-like [Mercenaria mercenaria]|uniref:synaptonemal complex protein 2-like n=1 Tax=Mercenaria mercenaria TaxID=6596 RepID=UPI00234EDB35|nr:synaptonemal complex protein 2-like [Mercenaria mercenaria]
MESVSKLVRHFEEGCLSTAALEDINKDHISKAIKELQFYIVRLDDDLLQLQDFLSSLQYLVKHNNSCYVHLFDQGLLSLMKVVFQQVLRKLLRDGLSQNLQYIIELCTETSNVLADINTKAKSSVVLELCPHFLDLLQVQLLGFQTRLEVLKSTNTLLEQCPTTVKEILLNREDNEEKIFGLVDLVKTVGDYEFQVGVIECLMRMFPRKRRHHFASKFFSDQDMLDGFMVIKDKDFEIDCRRFLNSVNAQSEDPNKGVFSLPCVRALVGNKQLRKPSDAGYEEFWVDFNIGSERLTLFCEQDSLYSQGTQIDEELWETVAIYKTDVLQCACHELDGLIELEICLKSPVCDIYPSQHQDVTDNKIKVYFLPELEDHIAHAVGFTFDFSEKKSKVSTVKTPLQISMKDVEDADSKTEMNYPVQNPVMPSPAQTGSQESVSRRRKVSVPSIPMQIPIASPAVSVSNFDQQKPLNDTIPETQNLEPVVLRPDVHSKASSSIHHIVKTKQDSMITSKESTRDFAVPKTPVKKTRSKTKVKTPVVTVTPPTRKTRKQVAQCSAAANEKENVSRRTVEDEIEQQDMVIPDSLPFTEDSQCKVDTARSVKASVSNEKGLDDSGIGVDESRSTIVCDALDTSRDSKLLQTDAEDGRSASFVEEKCDTKKLQRLKGRARKYAESKQTLNKPVVKKKLDINDLGHNEHSYRVLKPLEEESEDETTIEEEKKDNKNNSTNAKETNVGFNSLCMDEVVDSIPDSLENPVLPYTPPNREETSESKANLKSKKQKKSKNIKISDKTDTKKMDDKDKQSISAFDEDVADSGSENKENAVKSGVRRSEIKRKESFTDIDKSLKELHDLDNKEHRSEVIEVETDAKSGRLESQSGRKNENLGDLYTFSDPDPDFGKPELAKNKKTLNLNKNNKRSKMNSKCDTGNHKVSEKGNMEESDRPKQGKGSTIHDKTLKLNDDEREKIEKLDRPKQGKCNSNLDETINLKDDERGKIEKLDRPKQGKCNDNLDETINPNDDIRGKIEKSSRSKQGKKHANIQNERIKQTVGKGKMTEKPDRPKQGKNVCFGDETVDKNYKKNDNVEKSDRHKQSEKNTSRHNEETKQKDSEKGRIGKTDKPKRGKDVTCNDLNQVSKIKIDNATESRRSLRRRGNQTYKEVENIEAEEISSPSSSNESKESSVQSGSPLSDHTPTEKSLTKKTPENSPSKCYVNEQKIKSSLKKSKNSSDSVKEKDANKRKSRVSFDLPNSESQDNQPFAVQGTKYVNETVESIDDISEIIENDELDIRSPETSDELFKVETTEIEGKIDYGREDNTKSNKIAAEGKWNNKQSTRSCKQTKERENSADEKYVASKIIHPVSSSFSSSESSDSLYIESDDSYNARRYKMENGCWNTYKRKRRSSLKTRSKDFSSETKKNSSFNTYNEKKCDSFQTLSKERENKNDEDFSNDIATDKEKSKKTARKPKGPRKGSENNVIAETETWEVVEKKSNQKRTAQSSANGNTHRKSRLDRSEMKIENGEAGFESNNQHEILNKNEKLSMHSDEKMVVEEEINSPDKEIFRKESGNLGKKLNGNREENEIQFDDIVNVSQLAVIPFNGSEDLDEEELQEKVKDKKRRSKDKKKGKNSTYTMKNSFERMDCDDSYAVSKQSIHTVSSAKGKSMVFQMSYLKSQSNSLNKKKSEKPYAKEHAYDPYDFDAQCENASMASERIGRKDISKELNSKHLKSTEKNSSKLKECKVKVEKLKGSPMDAQESFSQDYEIILKSRNLSSEKMEHSFLKSKENKQSRKTNKKYKDRTSRTEMTLNEDKSLQANSLMENSSEEMVIDLEDESDQKQSKSKKTNLVQDKKTKRWYRTETEKCQQTDSNSRKENNRPRVEKEKKSRTDFPSLDSFNKSMVNQVSCKEDDTVIIDSSFEENNISQFSKILKEISVGRGKFDQDFNISVNDDFEDDTTEMKTPCIIGSISSTPKVGSGKRKHYKPLNISVIKTPQSCKITDSDSGGDSQTGKCKVSKRKSRKKKVVKYKEDSESDSEDERSECKSRMSTESISVLDTSQNISNRSEKSWILERKKTPKLKKSSKTYKVKKKMKNSPEQNLEDSAQSEDLSDEEQSEQENNDKLQKMKEYLLPVGSPLTIPSLSLNTPAVTPSIRSLKSYEDAEDYILTPPSPKKHSRKREDYDDIEVEQTQENCTISLNVSCQDSDGGDSSFEDVDSHTGLSAITPHRLIQSAESSDGEERSMHKLLQRNMKLLLGDSGFASGPSSEVRPTRSALKRKFPDIEETSNIVSSSSSQMESDDEMEKSIFIPKKLFKFDPAVNTPQAPSLYSDVTEEHEADFGFQSGLSTVMAAFGADIQHHLKSKKQKIERFTKDTLKETQKHFHQTVVEQQQYLSNLKDDFGARMLLELTALEKDIQRLNDAEKNMEEFFKCQLDVLRNNEESQGKRLNNMKKLQSCFLDKSKKVKNYNLNVHKNMQEQLRKDMAALQRKLIAETQRQEFMDVKMKLQKLFN